jgi:hypothetical protein
LEPIALANPASKTAIEYLGALSLVTKDTEFFSSMLDRFYGTDVLPTLPLSFQQAVVSIYDNDPAMWDYYGVPVPVRERFEAFKSRLRENQTQNGLANIMRGQYGDTFWFYQMFK